MPKRIQRKRTKGWRMPENTVSVTRPGKWGNPYKEGVYSRFLGRKCEDVFDCITSFKYYVNSSVKLKKIIKEELKGKDVACWCKEGADCHGDILLKIANS